MQPQCEGPTHCDLLNHHLAPPPQLAQPILVALLLLAPLLAVLLIACSQAAGQEAIQGLV